MADALQAAHSAGHPPRCEAIQHPGQQRQIGSRRSEGRRRRPNSPRPNFESPAPNPAGEADNFGIGQVVSEEALAGLTRMGFTQTMISPGSSSQTGTHMYMDPELLAGQPASTGSDIFSLGVVLYQLVSGGFTRPLHDRLGPAVSDPLLREDLEKCFASDSADRFASAQDLAVCLRTLDQRRSARAAREQSLRRKQQIKRVLATWRWPSP